MSTNMMMVELEGKDSDMIVTLLHYRGYVQGLDGGMLTMGPRGGQQVRRCVDGQEWATMKPLMMEWADARIELIMEMSGCRRCADEIGELVMSPELGSEAHDIILGKAEAKQAKALRKVFQAKAAERALAQRLADLDFYVAE